MRTMYDILWDEITYTTERVEGGASNSTNAKTRPHIK